GAYFEYRWDNINAFPKNNPKQKRLYLGNSKFGYQPLFKSQNYGAALNEGISLQNQNITATIGGKNKRALILYQLPSPYVYCKASLEFQLVRLNPKAQCLILAGPNSQKLHPLWQSQKSGQVEKALVDLEPILAMDEYGPKHNIIFALHVSMAKGQSKTDTNPDALLQSIRFDSHVMTSPAMLPTLKLGNNKVKFSAEGKVKVKLVHSWKESDEVKIPATPQVLESPVKGESLRSSLVKYSWQEGENMESYHLQVSLDPEFRWPYRPNLDVIVSGNSYKVPFRGIYSPKHSYYWRIKQKSIDGVWSDWSQSETFQWQGPSVVKELELTNNNGYVLLKWRPPVNGSKAIKYRVFGSDMKGFSPIYKETPEMVKNGEVVNLLGETSETSMLVAGYQAQRSRPKGVINQNVLNRCHYRVVAIDDMGVESGPSHYVSIARPFLLSQPNLKFKRGQNNQGRLLGLASRGDLQGRMSGAGFWDEEQVKFKAVNAPAWFRLAPTGDYMAAPPVTQKGRVTVKVQMTNYTKKKTQKDVFAKDLPDLTKDVVLSLEFE
ncbi:MAG: hypothetical protein HQL32_17020, partial [Planctomycetes bacterium]|nr:hypothetical protein [Planctomycetota bacterium]